MGKITVKRFLQKRLKPIDLNNTEKKAYPLYYSITYNRKTQNIKSPLGAVMSDEALDFLNYTNKIFSSQTLYPYTGKNLSDVIYLEGNSSYINLEQEAYFLEKSVELIVNDKKKENIFNKDFTPQLKYYFENLKTILYKSIWSNYIQNISTNKIENKEKEEGFCKKINQDKSNYFKNNFKYFQPIFYNSFNENKNLLDIIGIIKEVTNIDFRKYFYEDTLKFWEVAKAIELAHGQTCVVDFVVNLNEKKYIEIAAENNFEVTKEEIILIAKKLKNNIINNVTTK